MPKNNDKRCLGRLPRKASLKSLIFSHYLLAAPTPPAKTNFWAHRAPIPIGSWGNDEVGCCTIAKQVNMFTRFERLEQKRTIEVTKDEVLRVYYDMTKALYGGGDTGAYEEDALSWTRDPAKTIKDVKGRPLTNDAYMRVNAADQNEVKRGMFEAAGHGLAICINLPNGFSDLLDDPNNPDWDYPDNTPLTGNWMPGSWGGHSMWAFDYDKYGVWLDQTWMIKPKRITWRAWAAFVDEVHVVVDSKDAWRTRGANINIDKLVSDVNAVSSIKI